MRKAFTLVEMLVVLTLIAILAALLVFTLPGFIDRSRAANGASAVQKWLNYNRQRAQYEQSPRGMRFYVEQDDPTDPLSPFWVRRAQAIEKPDDWTPSGQQQLVADPLNQTDPRHIKVTGVNFQNGAVAPNDYLEVNSTGQVHQIIAVGPSDPTQPNTWDKLTLAASGLPQPITEPITNARIMRQPRVAGDEAMQLPERVIIDMGVYKTHAAAFLSKNAPMPAVVTDSAGGKHFDVLFGPSGQVLNLSPFGAMVILWVRMDEPNTTEFDNNPTLIAVSMNSGSVSAYDPVPPGAGPNPLAKVK